MTLLQFFPGGAGASALRIESATGSSLTRKNLSGIPRLSFLGIGAGAGPVASGSVDRTGVNWPFVVIVLVILTVTVVTVMTYVRRERKSQRVFQFREEPGLIGVIPEEQWPLQFSWSKKCL
jgi:hypothetical protein